MWMGRFSVVMVCSVVSEVVVFVMLNFILIIDVVGFRERFLVLKVMFLLIRVMCLVVLVGE